MVAFKTSFWSSHYNFIKRQHVYNSLEFSLYSLHWFLTVDANKYIMKVTF